MFPFQALIHMLKRFHTLKTFLRAASFILPLFAFVSQASAGGSYSKTVCYGLDNGGTRGSVFSCYVHEYGNVHMAQAAIWKERYGVQPIFAFTEYFDTESGNAYVGSRYYNGISGLKRYGNSSMCARVNTAYRICYVWNGAQNITDDIPSYPPLS